MDITGIVKYQELEGGFWSIIGDDGTEYAPIGMPDQLKHEGRKVSVKASNFEGVSMMMWGTPITIHSFHTLMP
jgi:hypothetical protein